MESVFGNLQGREELWRTAKVEQPGGILHSGVLKTTAEGGRKVAATFKLTASRLYQCKSDDLNADCVAEIQISWLLLRAFEDCSEQGSEFGFSLCGIHSQTDFYAQSSEDLSLWLDWLEPLCLLTDIEDDYSTLSLIGKGGQAHVCLGESLRNGEKVAIKCFDKHSLEQHPKKLQALCREIDVLRTVRHPRIMELRKVYEDERSVYLVTEYIPGQNLFDSLQSRGRFSEKEGETFINNLLDVLDYLRSLGVLHRDLKPENLIVTEEKNRGEFKVIDFGFAVKSQGKVLKEACGSPGYIAPEIILDHAHGDSVDIYSSGILVFIVIGGYSPFYAKTAQQVLERNAIGDITFSKTWEDIDGKYKKVVRAMTSFHPELRKSIPQLRQISRQAKCNESSQISKLTPEVYPASA